MSNYSSLENHVSGNFLIFAYRIIIGLVMPTVFIVFGFRFLFYSNDHEPIHIHIIKDDCEAKYNVCPIEQIYNHGFKKHQIAIIESIIEENEMIIVERWKTFFNK